MLFLVGVYTGQSDSSQILFQWVKALTGEELHRLTQTIALCVGRYLQRQGLLECDAENRYLAYNEDPDVMDQQHGHSVTYRIALGSNQGRKVFTLQTLSDRDDDYFVAVGKVDGFSLHAGVATKANERDKLERLCRNVSRPAVSEKRLSLTSHGKIRYKLKTPFRSNRNTIK